MVISASYRAHDHTDSPATVAPQVRSKMNGILDLVAAGFWQEALTKYMMFAASAIVIYDTCESEI